MTVDDRAQLLVQAIGDFLVEAGVCAPVEMTVPELLMHMGEITIGLNTGRLVLTSTEEQ